MPDPINDYQQRYEYIYRSPHVARVTVRGNDGKVHIIRRPTQALTPSESAEAQLTLEMSNGLRIRL